MVKVLKNKLPVRSKKWPRQRCWQTEGVLLTAPRPVQDQIERPDQPTGVADGLCINRMKCYAQEGLVDEAQ